MANFQWGTIALGTRSGYVGLYHTPTNQLIREQHYGNREIKYVKFVGDRMVIAFGSYVYEVDAEFTVHKTYTITGKVQHVIVDGGMLFVSAKKKVFSFNRQENDGDGGNLIITSPDNIESMSLINAAVIVTGHSRGRVRSLNIFYNEPVEAYAAYAQVGLLRRGRSSIISAICSQGFNVCFGDDNGDVYDYRYDVASNEFTQIRISGHEGPRRRGKILDCSFPVDGDQDTVLVIDTHSVGLYVPFMSTTNMMEVSALIGGSEILSSAANGPYIFTGHESGDIANTNLITGTVAFVYNYRGSGISAMDYLA